jgi:hypothetical protein
MIPGVKAGTSEILRDVDRAAAIGISRASQGVRRNDTRTLAPCGEDLPGSA